MITCRRKRRVLAGLLLLLVLLLAGGAWFPARAADKRAEPARRYCLWMLWLGDRSLLGPVQKSLEQGQPFMVVARLTARRHPKKAKVSADCLDAAKLASPVLKALAPLELGQVSRPFDLGGGVALVMRTTDAYRRRGQALYDQGKYAQAEKELLQDLKLHPAAAPTWHVVGLCRAARGDYAGALKALDQALKWTPANAALWNDKASVLGLMGRKQEAREHFERALALDPRSPLIKSNLAWSLCLLGSELDRAEKLARQALEQEPGNRRFQKTLQKIRRARSKAAEDKAKPRSSGQAKAARPKRAKTEPGPEVEYPRVAVAGHKPRSLVRVKRPAPARAASGPRKPRAAAAPPAGSYKAYIEIGAFRDHRRARREVARWVGRGYATRMERWERKPGQVWLRVMLGPFSDRAKARRMARRLKSRRWIRDYHLVVRPKGGG